MKQSIEEMTDFEILEFLNAYNNGVRNRVLDFDNEYDFSDEALFNILVAVDYLVLSGQNPKAEEMFAELYKRSEIELKNRLGVLPTIDTTE